jgi:hypothetical protein
MRLDDVSDHDGLLEAFRAQVARAATEEAKWLVWLAWTGQRGISRDEITDIVRASVEGRPVPPASTRPRPGSVQRSPFG